MAYKIGTKEKPMVLKTPPLTSQYTMHVDVQRKIQLKVGMDLKKDFVDASECIFHR